MGVAFLEKPAVEAGGRAYMRVHFHAAGMQAGEHETQAVIYPGAASEANPAQQTRPYGLRFAMVLVEAVKVNPVCERDAEHRVKRGVSPDNHIQRPVPHTGQPRVEHNALECDHAVADRAEGQNAYQARYEPVSLTWLFGTAGTEEDVSVSQNESPLGKGVIFSHSTVSDFDTPVPL